MTLTKGAQFEKVPQRYMSTRGERKPIVSLSKGGFLVINESLGEELKTHAYTHTEIFADKSKALLKILLVAGTDKDGTWYKLGARDSKKKNGKAVQINIRCVLDDLSIAKPEKAVRLEYEIDHEALIVALPKTSRKG